MRLFVSLALSLVVPVAAHAHGGGLNSDGCHTNRRTGEYHCHRTPSNQPRSAYTPPARTHQAHSSNINASSGRNGYAAQPRPQQAVQSLSSPPTQQAAPRSAGRRADGSFRNCRAAREAGAAPVYRGESGYGPHLDRDGDGVGCEPYYGY